MFPTVYSGAAGSLGGSGRSWDARLVALGGVDHHRSERKCYPDNDGDDDRHLGSDRTAITSPPTANFLGRFARTSCRRCNCHSSLHFTLLTAFFQESVDSN